MNNRDKTAFDELCAGRYKKDGERIADTYIFASGIAHGRATANPPLSKECPECKGTGVLLVAPGIPGVRANAEDIHGPCSCDKGRIWIYYTPEEYKAKCVEFELPAPVLDGDTAGWKRSGPNGMWVKCYLDGNEDWVKANLIVLNLAGQPRPRDNYRHG
jgi:hypothetical protein